MAIKRGLRPSIAEVGKIKTGEKGEERKSGKGNPYQLPVRLDYFKLTTTERGPDGNYIEDSALLEKLGGKPKELRIRLPFDTVDKNFFTQFMAYVGNKKVCAGDGIEATRKGQLKITGQGTKEKIVQTGETPTTIECNTETCPIFLAGKCKVCGILSCFLTDAPNVGGLHKYRTHGWNATASILGALEYFHKNTGGILMDLPLKLVMVKKTTQDHGTINYATVVIDGEQIAGLRRLALQEKQTRARLLVDVNQIEADAEASGFFEDSDPEELIQQEYYPDVPEEETGMRNVTPEPEPKKKGASGDDLADQLNKDAAPESQEKPKKSNKKEEPKPAEKVVIGDNTGKAEAAMKGDKGGEEKKEEKPPAETTSTGNLGIF